MRKEICILGMIALFVIAAAWLGSTYYRNANKGQRTSLDEINRTLVRTDNAKIGADDAKVTVVEFFDPECESCAAFAPTVKSMLKIYDGKVRLVARYMPLHPNSMPASNFLEAANEQGKFWQALELIFSKQDEWGTKHGAPAESAKPDVRALFEGYARSLGLDPVAVVKAMDKGKFNDKIARDRTDGQTLGVRQTPTIFINGKKLARLSEDDLKKMIDDELSQ